MGKPRAVVGQARVYDAALLSSLATSTSESQLPPAIQRKDTAAKHKSEKDSGATLPIESLQHPEQSRSRGRKPPVPLLERRVRIPAGDWTACRVMNVHLVPKPDLHFCTVLSAQDTSALLNPTTPMVQRSHSWRKRKQEELEAQMLNSVFAGLLGEDGVIKDAQETLKVADQVLQRRREKLHGDWSQNVYGLIQKRIWDALGNMSTEDIEKKLRHDASDYSGAMNSPTCASFNYSTLKP